MIKKNWYYKYYQEIFGNFRDYESEIEIVSHVDDLECSILVEIGSGTGNHVSALLHHDPKKIYALDSDERAIEYLKEKFSGSKIVECYLCDGFVQPFSFQGILLVFFSLVQRVEDKAVCADRINILSQYVLDGSYKCAWFEWIDVDVHLRNNKGLSTSLAHSQFDLTLTSQPVDFGVQIEYRGQVEEASVAYTAPVCRITHQEITSIVTKRGLKVTFHPMSSSGRKYLVRISC